MTPNEKKVAFALILVSIALICITTAVGSERAAIFIDGIGAFGQVGIAIMLYLVTRDQLLHTRMEFAQRQRLTQAEVQDRQRRSLERLNTSCGGFLASPDKPLATSKLQDIIVEIKGRFGTAVDDDLDKLLGLARKIANASPNVIDDDYGNGAANFARLPSGSVRRWRNRSCGAFPRRRCGNIPIPGDYGDARNPM